MAARNLRNDSVVYTYQSALYSTSKQNKIQLLVVQIKRNHTTRDLEELMTGTEA